MGKIKQWIKNIAQFFTSLSNLASYTEDQKKVSDQLNGIASLLENLSNKVSHMSQQLDDTTNDLNKVKSGLQRELFHSLQVLHTLYCDRGWASPEEKLEVQGFYDEIHNLGQDGWCEKRYQEIIALPESKEQMYKKQQQMIHG